MPPALPTEPEHLTDAWLTEILCGGRSAGAASVVSHRWETIAEQGAASVVGRVSLTYDRETAGAPVSVVMKFATPHAPIRTIIHQLGLYRSEVEFYRQIGPDAGIPIPHCYHADIDTTSGYFVLAIEDMKDSRVGDPFRPAVADVEQAIDRLAPFHAKWWNSPRLREFDWLPYPGDPVYEARSARVQQSFGAAAGAVRQKLGPQFPDVLSIACDRILSDWRGFVQSRLAGPLTLEHRDFHAQQLFFPSERGGRFAVFDWQTVGVGPGADDLARGIAGLPIAERAANDERLIARYHERLLASGVTGYPLARCQRDFGLGLTASLTINVVAAATIDLSLFSKREAESGVGLMYGLFDRLAAAFEAHGVIDLLPGRQWA
ncbi:MAG TPA: phosphotransferase [Vicinamibacterales bacterium]|jgi:hypothetical protein